MRVCRSTLFVAILLVVSTFQSAFAQGRVDKYTVTKPTLTFTDLRNSGGTYIYSDVWRYYYGSLTTSLPFNFNYDNATIPAGTTLYIQDAWIGIGVNPSYGATYGGLTNSSYQNVLYPLGCPYVQMGDNASNNGGLVSVGILSQTTGVAPNRVFTIQMSGVHPGWGGQWNEYGALSDIQVKFFETSNVIEFLYSRHGQNLYGSYASAIGINGSTSPSFAYNTVASGINATPNSDIVFTPPPPPAQLSLQPKTLNFGFTIPTQPVTMCANINSVGSFPLHITRYTLTGSSDFQVTSIPPNGTAINAGSSAQVCFSFTPSASGNRSATFNLVTDGADSGTQSIILTGNGLLPNVAYNRVDMFRKVRTRLGNTSAPQYIQVQSNGTAPLTFNGIYMIGLDAASYTVVHTPPNPMPQGTTDSIGIVFNPHIEGRPDAQLVIGNNSQNMPWDTVRMLGIGVLPRLVVMAPPDSNNFLAFDSVAIGDSVCQTVLLQNPGSDTLHFMKQIVTSADYDFNYYGLTGTDTLILPGASKLVNVCFRPLKNGERFATIRFYTDIPKTFTVPRADTSQFVLNVSGVGVPYGILAFHGVMDTAIIGQAANCVNDTIVNRGLADLTVTKVTVSGPTASSFSSNVAVPFTLAPGQSKIVSVCFTATTRGLLTVPDTVKVNGTSSGRNLSLSMPINGVGLMQCASAVPASAVTFPGTGGITQLKMTGDTTIVVSNCGDVAETFTTSAVTAPYTITPATSAPVAAGGTTTFHVSFAPTAMGAANQTLTITGGPTPIALTLSGIGGDAVLAPTVPALTIDKGDCRNDTIVIKNNGNMDWTATGTPMISGTNASDFTWVSGPGTIPAGGTGQLVLKFCATMTGSESATVTFPTESPVPSAGATSINVSASGASSGVAIVTSANGFSIGQSYPNPTNGSADVIVTMPMTAPVHIDLVDAHGSIVKSEFNGVLSQGDHTIALSAANLANGTYFYVLTSGETRLAREITVMH